MKRFIVIYHAPADAMQQTSEATQEEMEKGMEPWMEWAKRCGNKLLDLGTPLLGGIKLNSGGAAGASEKEVVGYSILQAEDMQEAKALMNGHPHLDWTDGCEIEIHESMPLPGM